MDRPETNYAWNGDVSLAYQVVGGGPVDVLFVPGRFSNLDLQWDPDRWRLCRVAV